MYAVDGQLSPDLAAWYCGATFSAETGANDAATRKSATKPATTGPPKVDDGTREARQRRSRRAPTPGRSRSPRQFGLDRVLTEGCSDDEVIEERVDDPHSTTSVSMGGRDEPAHHATTHRRAHLGARPIASAVGIHPEDHGERRHHLSPRRVRPASYEAARRRDPAAKGFG